MKPYPSDTTLLPPCAKRFASATIWLAILFAVWLSSFSTHKVHAQDTATSLCPNILLLLVDDLGANDLGCTGSNFYQTPAIDQLAAQSIHYRTAYAAASVCSPSRGALLTGLHPVQLNITDWIPGNPGRNQPLQAPEDASELALSFQTLGEVFQQNGYQTFYAGKWHLGGQDFSPAQQGFDVYVDPHHSPERGQPANRPVGTDRPHATRTMTKALQQFLENRGQQPFLAILSYYDVHTPLVPEKDFLSIYQQAAESLPPRDPIVEHSGQSRAQQNSPVYGSMVSAVDESVGKLMASLKEQQLADDTIVIFTSDNGGLCTLRQPGPTCNLPLRSGKGWLYEGGIRVPLIVKRPHTPPQEIDAPVSLLDIFPSLIQWADLPENKQALAGIALPQSKQPDLGQRSLFWHYPHYHGSTWAPGAAVRQGDWKLIHFYETGINELYRLDRDPGELHNLADQDPDRVQSLLRKLQNWQKTHDAALPTPVENPGGEKTEADATGDR